MLAPKGTLNFSPSKIELRSEVPHATRAVSYTHLDVYKRQIEVRRNYATLEAT